MNKLIIAAAFFCLLFTACKKNDVTERPAAGSGKIQLVKGNNQPGLFGELLKDTIVLKITSANPEDHFLFRYSLKQGNGKVEMGGYPVTFPVTLDTAGTVRFMWRMGCDYNVQQLTFYLYSDSVKSFNSYPISYHQLPSDSITVTANAVKPNGWCKACGTGYVDQYYSSITSFDNNTLYLANYGLYSSTDGGLNWYMVNGVPYWSEVINAQFNSKGWLYVLTKNHGVYYSKDIHQWNAINNGFLDPREPTGFYVEDSALWVSYYFDGPYRSTNNGDFWRKVLVGGGSQRFYLFSRHPNGSMFLFDDWNDLKMSKDNGTTWQAIFGYYSDVRDLKIDPHGTIYIGSGDATLTVIDSVATTVHRYYQWNASAQSVSNIVFSGNDVFYLVNDTPSPGVYSKGTNWNRIDIGFTDRIVYFFLKKNGAFLLFSNGRLYYHH